MFPPASPELFFAQWYKRYGSGALLKCKGDGEIAETTEEFAKGLEKIGETDRGFIQVVCKGPDCVYQTGKNEFCEKPQCAAMAALQVILPELSGIGVWQISTGSYNSIVNINSALEWLKGLCGRYAMIPLWLMRVPQDIQYEGKKSKHYILQIDQNISIGEIQKFVSLTPVERALIPAPDEKKDELFYGKNGEKPLLPAPEKEGLIEEQLTEILEKIKSFTTREEVDAFEKECETMSLAKVDIDLIRDHCVSARHTITGEKLGKGPISQPAAPSANDYGDLKRFGSNQTRAAELIEKIKQYRAKLGEEKFMKILGGQGWAAVAEITLITPLTTLLNAIMAEVKK